MKSLFICALSLLMIFNQFSFKFNAIENRAILNKSKIIIANKYADRFCHAKANNFFEGLDNEKTLKYSYYRYMGFQNKEIFSNDLYKTLINQIKEKCNITISEEKELNEYLFNKS